MSFHRQLATVTAFNYLLLAVALSGLGACSEGTEPEGPVLTTAAVAGGDGQTSVVGTVLSLPLRARAAAAGAPQAGVAVTWRTTKGSLSPASSVTDSVGIATAVWTLDTVAGADTAYASVAGALGSPVRFAATGLAGPVASIDKVGGDGQTVAVNGSAFSSVVAAVRDKYGNGVGGQAVTWVVKNGPVVLSQIDTTTSVEGLSVAVFAPEGHQGSAVVQAALPGGTQSVDFAVTVGPPELVIFLEQHGEMVPPVFVSGQNGSRAPAVDTIAVGKTMKWELSSFFYEPHRLVSVGNPSFQIKYGLPFYVVTVTFTAPGTYRYADYYNPGSTGILVVQ